MDRESARSAGRGDQRPKRPKAPKGLRLIERDGYWHIHGSIRIEGRSVRVRTSTGYTAGADNRARAEDEIAGLIGRLRAEIVHGTKPSIAIAQAAAGYLAREDRSRPLGWTSVKVIQEAVAKFRTRLLDDISEREWHEFVSVRMAGRQPATRERYLNTLLAFLGWCARRPRQWLAVDKVPLFDRNAAARNPRKRKNRRVEDLRPDLILLFIQSGEPHFRGQAAAMWSTGARNSSVLHGARVCDLILAPGREQITFRTTKNDDDVTASLHPAAAEILRDYMKWRGGWNDRDAPLFLTEDRKPYKQSVWGQQNRRAFRTARRRTVMTLLRQAARSKDVWEIATLKADARLMAQITPHWFRAAMATHVLAATGNVRIVMDQGGWRDSRVALSYARGVPAVQRAAVNLLAVATELTRPKKPPAED